MRIVHLAKYYHPFRGGIETHVRALANAQANAGHEVTVLCINHADAKGNDVWNSKFAGTKSVEESDGLVRVRRVGKIASFARFDFCPSLSSAVRKLSRQCDLFHLHVPNPTMCVAVATNSIKCPLVVSYHSDIVKQKWLRKPFKIIEDRVYNRASRFVVATENYLQSSPVLARFLPKSTVVPYGIDLTSYLSPSEEALRFAKRLRDESGGSPIWLCVGRLVYYKGTEIAIRALADCNGRLLIVGSGPLESSLKSLASATGVSDRVQWFPNLSDEMLVGAYHAATAFWFPSIARSEAFGLVQVEAMASGCPVINSSIPGSGVSWVSLHEQTGLTVEPNQPRALAEQAKRLEGNRELREFLSENARLRAKVEFDVDTMLRKLDAVYADVIECKAGSK